MSKLCVVEIDGRIQETICELFETEKFEEIPKDHQICYSCQQLRSNQTSHCKYIDRCVYGYDHFCNFTCNAIGKGNHRLFFGVILLNLVGEVLFIYLLSEKVTSDLKYEYFTKFFILALENLLRQQWYLIFFAALTALHIWYNFWYVFLICICISQGATVNESLNRSRHKNLFINKDNSKNKKLLCYNNPNNKGIVKNWINFFNN